MRKARYECAHTNIMFETNIKPKFLDPVKIINGLSIDSGMSIAHFGCSSGFFTFPIAKKIGNNGKVYALDVLEQKIESIKSQAKLIGAGNIIAMHANLEERNGSKLEDNSLDWVVMVNMLFQNERRNRIIGEAKRILKLGGQILLIDWKDEELAIGPEKGVRISKKELIKMARKNGLGIIKEFEAGSFHNAFILVK